MNMTDGKALFPEITPDDTNLDELRVAVEAREAGHLADEDPWADNNLRAAWAGLAVLAFVDRVGGDDTQTAISDLLADLKHLCDALGCDFQRLLDRGEMHYEAEVMGE